MANVKLPDNAELEKSLAESEMKMEEIKLQKQEKLPGASKQAIDDTTRVVRDIRKLLHSKNKGNRLQAFLTYMYRSGTGLSQAVKKAQGPKKSRPLLQRVPEDLRKLATLLITSRKFRDFLEEALEVCQAFGWNILHARDPDYTPRQVNIRALVQKELENRDAASTIRGTFRLIYAFFLEEINQNKELLNEPEAERWRREANEASNEAKEFIEQFTQGMSLDSLINNIRTLFNAIQNDKNIRDFFFELREYLERPLREPQIVDEKYFEKGDFLVNYGLNYLQNERYNKLTSTIIQQLRDVVRSIKEDPDLQQLINDLKKLNENFYVMDSAGNKKLNVELFIEHLRLVVIPVIIKVLNRIRLPPIVGHDESYDYEINNVVFAAEDVLPENIRIENLSVVELRNVASEIQVENPVNRIKIDIKRINFMVHEADLKFTRKTIPSVSDSGKLDIEVDKAGTDLNIILNAEHVLSRVATRLLGGEETELRPLYNVEDAKCVIHNLNVKFKETKHDTLYNLFVKLFPGVIKSRVQIAIEENIRNVLEDFRYRARADFYQIPDFMESTTDITPPTRESAGTLGSMSTGAESMSTGAEPMTTSTEPMSTTTTGTEPQTGLSEMKHHTGPIKIPISSETSTAGERSTKM